VLAQRGDGTPSVTSRCCTDAPFGSSRSRWLCWRVTCAACGTPRCSALAGTHAVFERKGIGEWLRTRVDHHDRADWAVLRAKDGAFLGEAVTNDLDPTNDSASYRVWLAGPQALGHGYGTETTSLIVCYA